MTSRPFGKHGKLRMASTTHVRKFDKPRPNAFLAAGYLFSKGSFAKEVPYDPHMYFSDEEISLAARAYTHGWDGFAPSRVFIYHYYFTPEESPQKHLHWKDQKKWRRLSRVSRARREYLFCGIEPVDNPEYLVDVENYSLGDARTMADYENFCGIDFKKQEVSEMALKGDNPKSLAAGSETPGSTSKRAIEIKDAKKEATKSVWMVPVERAERSELKTFFASGYNKSGTTFLQMLLNAHPTVNCASEQHFLTVRRALDTLATQYEEAPSYFDKCTAQQGIRFDKDQFIPRIYKQVLLELMHCGTDDTTTHSGLNDNSLFDQAAFLADLLPAAKFVFIIRDPRDVGISLWHHKRRVDENFAAKNSPIQKTIAGVCRAWPKHLAKLEDFGREYTGRAHIVRYESMIGPDRDAHAGEMLAFLGVAFNPETLNSMWRATDFDQLKKRESKMMTNGQDGFFRSAEPESWRHLLDNEQKQAAVDAAGSALEKYGYTIVD